MNETTSGQNPRRHGRLAVIIAGIIAAALACAVLLCCALAASADGFFPGTQLENINVGGMTAEEAARALDAEVSGRLFAIRLDTAESDPVLVLTAQQLLLVPEGGFSDAVDNAFAAQRSTGFFAGGIAYLRSALGLSAPVRMLPEISGFDYIRIAEDAGSRISAAPVDAAYSVEGSSLMVLAPRDGRSVDPAELTAALKAVRAAETPEERQMVVSSSVVQAKTLTAQQIHDEIAGEMKNAAYDAETDTFLPETVGIAFDPEAAQRLMDAAVPGTYAAVELEVTQPAVTLEQLQQVLFRDVLGTYTTKVSGTKARRSNVKLSAAAINGLVLNSGDVFSYNESVGKRTAEAGYQAAPAYVAGQTVDEIGGGICQTSSTLYMSTLLANLQIVKRSAHRYATAYMPWGMDATVSWGGPDFQFANSTDYPIRIVTEYSDNNRLTVTLYGTKTDDITVKMTYDYLEKLPWKTVYRDDPTLPAGTEVETVEPYTGHKVQTYRCLYDGDGNLISKTPEAYSYYKTRDKVISRGPALPEPEPEVPAVGGGELPAEPPAGETPGTADEPAAGGTDAPPAEQPAEPAPGETPPAEQPPAEEGGTETPPAETGGDTPPAEVPAEPVPGETPPAQSETVCPEGPVV